jgi:putative ABC transport system permease protein
MIYTLLFARIRSVAGRCVESQTLFAVTQDHRPNYATLLALGFSPGRLALVVVGQSLLLGLGGIGPGTAAFFAAARLSPTTAIPLKTTPAIFTGFVLLALLCCLLASFVSIHSVFRIDPVSVFRG